MEAVVIQVAVILGWDTGFVHVGNAADGVKEEWEYAGAIVNGANRGAAIGEPRNTTATVNGTAIIEVSHIFILIKHVNL